MSRIRIRFLLLMLIRVKWWVKTTITIITITITTNNNIITTIQIIIIVTTIRTNRQSWVDVLSVTMVMTVMKMIMMINLDWMEVIHFLSVLPLYIVVSYTRDIPVILPIPLVSHTLLIMEVRAEEEYFTKDFLTIGHQVQRPTNDPILSGLQKNLPGSTSAAHLLHQDHFFTTRWPILTFLLYHSQ